MTDLVYGILKRDGPSLSSAVAAALIAEHGMSEVAARQRVFRRSETVKRVDLKFPRNARFLYLAEHYGTRQFWKNLALALVDGTYARAITALQNRGGIMPVAHFSIACGAPLEQMRQVPANLVRIGLTNAGLIEQLEVPGVGLCVAFAKGVEYLVRPVEEMKARLVAETILLSAIKEWARNLGLGSYNSFQLRSDGPEQPRVGSFLWDMTAPSYVGGLATYAKDEKPKPGFVVFDVLLGNEMTEAGMAPFIHKCTTLRRLKNVGRCMQYFVAERYTPAAARLAKSFGILPATPRVLFGDEVADALKELITVLTSAARASVDPDKFRQLFEKLGKIEGAVHTLRGALFEFIVAELARQSLRGNVEMNRVFRESGKEVAEVDVLVVVPRQVVHFIECKGRLPGRLITDTEIEEWLQKRIPIVRRHALNHPDWKHLELRFELWTTGELSETSRAMIEAAQATVNPSKYTIVVRNANEVEALAVMTNDHGLIDVLRQHFIEHPLADADGTLLVHVPESVALDDVPMALPAPVSGATVPASSLLTATSFGEVSFTPNR